jgi:hypothetical protein
MVTHNEHTHSIPAQSSVIPTLIVVCPVLNRTLRLMCPCTFVTAVLVVLASRNIRIVKDTLVFISASQASKKFLVA